MNSKEIFNGFSAETFRFLLEIGFNNNADWFEANRKRYEQFVRDPMRRLAAALMPTALLIRASMLPFRAFAVTPASQRTSPPIETTCGSGSDIRARA